MGYFTVRFNHNVQFKNKSCCRLSHLQAYFLEKKTHEEEPHLLFTKNIALSSNNALQSRSRFINAIQEFRQSPFHFNYFCIDERLSSSVFIVSLPSSLHSLAMPLNWNVHERLVSARDESETDKEIILRMTTIVDKIAD